MTITEAVRCYRAGDLTFEELVDELRARTWRAPHVASAQPGDDADWSHVSTADAEGSWLELARAWAANLLTAEELRAIEAEVPFDAPDDDDRETLGPSQGSRLLRGIQGTRAGSPRWGREGVGTRA